MSNPNKKLIEEQTNPAPSKRVTAPAPVPEPVAPPKVHEETPTSTVIAASIPTAVFAIGTLGAIGTAPFVGVALLGAITAASAYSIYSMII
jgi:hypothetical protein